MKKHLLFALILFMALPGMAQRIRIKPSQGENHQQHATTLTITAPQDLCFWLFIDDVLQNENAVHSICICNLEEDSYYIRVELDNEMQNCVGQFVDLEQSKTLTVIHSWKCWGFDDYDTNVTPELTMDVVTMPYEVNDEPFMPPLPEPIPPMTFGMGPEDYEDACQLISDEAFDSSRLTVAKQVVSANPMTANQILGICKLFSFESNKLNFAKYAYGYCVDQNKYYLLNDAFSYESSKRELDEFIRGL